MLTLVLFAHGLCLNVRPHPSFRAATAARTCGLRRGGGPALCAPPPRPQVQGRPLRESVEGTMTDDLEVLDVEIGGETPADFTAMGMLRTRVAANLAAMNITAPNALQSACFRSLAGGRDAIVQAHTGSGKTIAFLLPIIEQLNPESKEPQALVISPSRELAFQTARVAEQLLVGTGLSCVALSGGANPNRQMDKVRKARPQLLVGTPGRVAELAYEWQKLKLQRVRPRPPPWLGLG
jgi:superfamily II DNA/RNA helicase